MQGRHNQKASGIETDPGSGTETLAGHKQEAAAVIPLPDPHYTLTQVILQDDTDHHNELVFEKQWLLHPSEKNLCLTGNLFVIENPGDRSGRILVKEAPLPGARTVPSEGDVRIIPRKAGGLDVSLFAAAGSPDNPWTILEYQGGILERTRALHQWQQGRRPQTPGHTCPRFLSNTWGDRSRDSRINEEFILAEIDAAAQLSVDVVQIDDGWQTGITGNSALAKEKGGVWGGGFWNADPNFWKPHPERLPRGLTPFVEKVKANGMRLGLWFAPDSYNEFENWQRDAGLLLDLYSSLGIEHFKLDGIMAPTPKARQNLGRFFKGVLEGSKGNIVCDLDITAGVRPGYFGAVETGPLFVENRYTDWHNYWPHQTLRNLWKLAHWVDPRRLRMEFLNNTRHPELYPDDPLAPARYDPAALFATVMFSNPLGWFEVSNLPGPYVERVAELAGVWKTHRPALFSGTILPVGQAPDGYAYTGFMSLAETRDSGYVLVFRELNSQDSITLALPGVENKEYQWELLAGQGKIGLQDHLLHINGIRKMGFIFIRFSV